jgi:hypothetical protein
MLLISLVFVSSLTTVSFTQENQGSTSGVSADGTDTYVGTVSRVDEPDSLKYSAPKPVIYFDGYNTYINTRVAYKLSAKEDLQKNKLYYKIDNGSEKEYTAPFSFEAEGRHTVTYRSADRMERRGNENIFVVVLDDSAPVITLLSEVPVIKNEGIVYLAPESVFTIKVYDAYSGVNSVKYAINGEELKDYERSFSLPPDSKELDIKITASDNVGISTDKYTIKAKDTNNKDVEVSSAGLKLVRDTTPPDVVISADKEIFQNEKELNIVAKDYKYSISAIDEEAGVANILYRISGDRDFQNYTQPFTLKNSGINKIEAKAIDKVGNVSAPVALTVFVDVVPPTTLIKPIVDESTGY